jgi:hypothetical protein
VSAERPARSAERYSETVGRGELAILAAVFVLSRLLYWLAGVRFDDGTLLFYWQYVDPQLLKTDLWRSVLHLHSQPPLFNLFLGAVLRLPGRLPHAAFHALFAGCGLALGVALSALAARLGVPRALRLPAIALFLASPGCILTENLLFYTYPVMAALVLAALCLHRFAGSGRHDEGLACFGILAGVVLTQSLFHLVFFLVLVALGAAVALRGRRRAVRAAAALPILLAAAWYARNAALFGSFSSSTWLGMSLAKIATKFVSPAELPRLAREDPREAILAVEPFSPLADYAAVAPMPLPTGIPVLDRPWKSTGARNLNHLAYVEISRRSLAATRAFVARHPAEYLHGVVTSWLVYFRSGADSAWLRDNRLRVASLSRWFDRLAYLQPEPFVNRLGPSHIAWSILVLLPCVLVHGVRSARRRFREGDAAGAATLLFLVFTVAYVAVVGNSIEIGENNRFRFESEPLALALLLVFLAERLGSARAEAAGEVGPGLARDR